MKIIIISEESFYSSTAQENRQLSYAKGISELTHSVKILTLFPVEKSRRNYVNNNIEIEYLRSGYIKRSFFPRKAHSLIFHSKFFSILYKENKQEKVDCIIVQTFTNLPAIFLFFVSRLLNIKMIRDQAEYPEIHKSGYNRLSKYLYTNYYFKLFDGLAVINNALLDYFKDKIRRNARLLKFPMIVDPERFENLEKKNGREYIAYCGDMRNNKDGIPLLIDAFKIVSEKFPDLLLYLIGNTEGIPEVIVFKKQIDNLGLSRKIIFTGRVNRMEMPDYLYNARFLVLARPKSKQSEGGFPTKLGEYLATGIPVVVTNVGEISEFLIDGENAFVAEPDNIQAFANKLLYGLSHPEIANQVGLNGRKLAYTSFNYKIQTQKLIDFIKILK